jgi:glycine/D-amino acid oxidase-like deaminating enzyme
MSRTKTPGTISRRALLIGGGAGALGLGLRKAPFVEEERRTPTPKPLSTHVAVIGAGAFGGWTALHLLRAGARVTLVDAWGPGNSRASSGGETRVIRAGYGPDRIYVEMVARALELWRENQKRWNRHLFHEIGALWLLGDDDRFVTLSRPFIHAAGLPCDELTVKEASEKYPQIRFDGIRWAFFERQAGFLLARQGCQAVLEAFESEGGTFRLAAVPKPVTTTTTTAGSSLARLPLSSGDPLQADAFVFACGPWLPELFPDVLGNLIGPTRQEIFYFGTPPGDARYTDGTLSPWLAPPSRDREGIERFFYGIPGNESRGFKIADDTRGPAFDPTTGDRTPSREGIERAREYIRFRFPGLADAPLVEARVCQYEQSKDGHFILDRHPGLDNVWIAGGGSGHGYKHGPALGERVAEMVLGRRPVEPFFSLKRFE